MKNKNKLLLSAIASLAFAWTGNAEKQDAPELSPLSVLDTKTEAPVLTSGLKTSLSVKSSPKSLSIMAAEQIKEQGLKSVGDIIDYTPGVSNSQGEGHRDAAVIRGVRTTQDFYRDGIRDDVQYYRPLYNVEQVEIIRGSDALLSGFGGGHGIINRVSKKGVIGEDFTTLSGSLDTFGEHNVQLDKNVELNDNSALRVNIFGENLANHRDYYYGEGFGVNPTLNYNLGDGSSLILSYEYLDQERFIDRGIPSDISAGGDNRPMEEFKDIVFGDASENFSTHEAHIIRAIYEHELSDNLNGRFSVSHSSHDKLYQNLYVTDTWKAGGVTYNGYDPITNTVALDGYKDTTQRDTSILSYDISGEFKTGGFVHNFILGFQYLEMSNNNDRYNAAFVTDNNNDGDTEIFAIERRLDIAGGTGTSAVAGATNPSAGGTTTNYYEGPNRSLADRTFADVKVSSFYLNDSIAVTDSVDLVLGARFDSMDFDVSGTYPDSDSDDTISPRVGLIFDVTQEASFYGTYSETFAPKGGDQYATLRWKDSSGNYVTDSARLDPDTFENLEFGMRYDLPVGLTLAAAYFDIQTNKPELSGLGYSTMVKSESKGFEIEVFGSLTDKWFLSAGYTDLDAKDHLGRRVREAPENMFSIWNNYLITDRLGVNLGIIYQDESLSKTGNVATLPDYTRVDVGASYILSENTSVQMNIENLTDELYFPHSHSIHQASVGAPINATFGITSSF